MRHVTAPDPTTIPTAPSEPTQRIRSPRWRQHLPSVVLGAVCLLPLLTWWRGAELVWGLDGSFPLRLAEITRYFSLGSTAYSVPDARKLSLLLPWGLLLRALLELHVPWNPGIAQRLFEVGLLVTCAFGSRSLIMTLVPGTTRAAATVAALFYTANPYVLTTVWTSQSYLILHYSLLPLLGWLFIATLRKGGPLRWAAGGLGWTLLMSPAYITTPLAVTDVAFLVAICLWVAAVLHISWRRLAAGAAAVLSCWLVLNLYWLVPLFQNYGVTFSQGLASIAGTTSLQLFQLNSPPLLEALRFGGYWGLSASLGGSPYYPWASWNTATIDFLAYLPLAFTCLALLTAGTRHASVSSPERARSLTVLSLALVVLLFLVSSGTGPLTVVRLDLFRFTGLLDPFRSTYQRFMEYMPLVIAPMFAAGLDTAANLVRQATPASTRSQALGLALVWGAGLLAVVLVPLPFWTGGLFDSSGLLPSSRITIPPSYVTAARALRASGGSVLVLPLGATTVTYLRWRDGAQGFQGIQPLSFLSSLPVVDAAPQQSYSRRLLTSALHTRHVCSVLEQLNIAYLAVETDADTTIMHTVRGYIGLPLQHTLSLARAASCLRPVYSGTGVALYRNVRWTPDLVSFSNSPRHLGAPAHYTINHNGEVAIAPPTVRYRFLIVNEPNDGSWVLGGREPLPGTDLTAFRLPTHPDSHLLLTSPSSVTLHDLLLLSACLSGAIVLGAFGEYWRRRRHSSPPPPIRLGSDRDRREIDDDSENLLHSRHPTRGHPISWHPQRPDCDARLEGRRIAHWTTF